MDRKGTIAIALAFLVLFGWSQFFSRRMEKYQKEHPALATPAPASAPSLAAASPASAPLPPEGTPASAPAAPGSAPTAPGSFQKSELQKTTRLVDYLFTNAGGGLARARLREHQAEGGGPVELNLFGPTPIGAVTFRPGEEALQGFELVPGTAPQEVVYQRTEGSLRLTKKFILPQPGAPEEYQAHLEVQFANTGSTPLPVPAWFVHTGTAAPIHRRDLPNYTGFGWLREGKFRFKDSTSFGSGGLFGMGRTDQPVFTDATGAGAWAGVNDQYFTSIVTPVGAQGTGVWAHRFEVPREEIGQHDPANRPSPETIAPTDMVKVVEGALGLPAFTLAPGGIQTASFNLYTGPREYRRLKNLGAGEDAILDFGMFRAVCKLLLNALNVLHSWLGHSYGAAIVALTLVIRGLMWPLQNKGNQSMKRMQALAPEMNALKEKYADDPQRMSQEQMKLYKDYGINPVAGCLPLLVQMPIFFGFYSMLSKAVELRNSPFLWVHDLSQPDTLFHVAGFPVNAMPLLMMGTMIGQMQLAPKSADPMQQRIAMFMPLIFVSFCYNYPPALALYMTVQNIFSAAQLYLTRDQPIPTLQKRRKKK